MGTTRAEAVGLDLNSLRARARTGEGTLFEDIRATTRAAEELPDLLALDTLRRRWTARSAETPPAPVETIRVAWIGGVTTTPLCNVAEHCLAVEGVVATRLLGDFDNAMAETLDPNSPLTEFRPDVVVYFPSERLANPVHPITAENSAHETTITEAVEEIRTICTTVAERTGAEVIVANFAPSGDCEVGPYRSRALGTQWNYRRRLNYRLGMELPGSVTILDRDFLASREGLLACSSPRDWYQTRQPGSGRMVALTGKEIAHLILGRKRATAKVLVLDLDNTLWGGVIGDDGLEGIELGPPSPRGEAFQAFQRSVRALRDRGVLLCVASKNDLERAQEPFRDHPEMALRLDDITCFEANWGPKSESIRRMAEQLGLGLDSFVFVDDNPAEIEIVRQFCPEVRTVLLGDDPSDFIRELQEGRFFEPRTITQEDGQRAEQYRQEAERRSLRSQVTDMGAYLDSLEMRAEIHDLRPVDVPRTAQLINKSNQFNLTTRRRTEEEVRALLDDPVRPAFTIRLGDRFGDHGLISVLIGEISGDELVVDTWLMSCRVLERQVEQVALDALVTLAAEHGLTTVRGIYRPTAKNSMVLDLYPRLGFAVDHESEDRREFTLAVDSHTQTPTAISVERNSREHS